MLCSQARVAGFRFAHDEAGLPVDPRMVRYGNFYIDAGYEHGMDLLGGDDRPTAIFAGSDMQAIGVLRAARRLGLDPGVGPGRLVSTSQGYDRVRC